jgi:DNA-binding transcriptional MerR regulator
MLTAPVAPFGAWASPSHCHTAMVRALRVYQLADELGIESARVLRYLQEQGEPARSAASVIQPATARKVRAAFPAGRPGRRAPTRRVQGYSRDVWWDDDPWTTCPDQVTTTEAARLCGVRAATIRQWASRGYLRAVGRRGRSQLYDPLDLRRVQAEAQARTRRPPAPRSNVRSKDLDSLVTGSEAARIVGVSPSAIRMWVARGHLRPTSRVGRQSLFKVVDVLRATRRGARRRR